MKSTFIRKGKTTQPLPKGTKPSVFNGQILVSTGLHELDIILGGGIPLGSIICIKEDRFSKYSNNILQYYVSEGLATGQTCAVVTSTSSKASFLKDLPFNYTHYRTVNNKPEMDEEEEKEKSSSELKIAWRYKEFVDKKISEKKATIQKITKSVGSVECHDFDLSKNLQDDLYKTCENNLRVTQENDYAKIYDYLSNVKGEIVRIALQSLGALNQTGIVEFLYALKCLVRNSSSICIFTLPKDQFEQTQSIEKVCDIVLSMESFLGNEIDILEFQDFTGMMNVEKLSKLNSLTYNFAPDTLQYVFTRKKRKLYIEKMYLPPEVTRNASDPDREKHVEMKSVKESNLKDLEF
jgi:elongator complex protein 4